MLRRAGKICDASQACLKARNFGYDASVRAMNCFLHQSTCRHQTHDDRPLHSYSGLPFAASKFSTISSTFSRNASNSACAPKRRVSHASASRAAQDHTLGLLKNMRRILTLPETRLDFAEVWDVINDLMQQDGISRLDTHELFTLAYRISDGPTTQAPQRQEKDMNWLGILDHLLEELHRRRPFKYSPEEFWWSVLNSCALAQRGETGAAETAVRNLDFTRYQQENLAFTVTLYKHLILAYMKNDTVAIAFEFYSDHLRELKELSNASNIHPGGRFRHPVTPGSPFFSVLMLLVTSVTSPAEFLAEASDTWDKATRRQVGQLMIRAFCYDALPNFALAVRQELLEQKISVGSPLSLELVRALAKARSFQDANILYGQLSETDAAATYPRFYENTGLFLSAKQGDVAKAEHHFSRLQALGITTPPDLNLIMHAYAVNGDAEKVAQIFNTYFPQSSYPPNRGLRSQERKYGTPSHIHYTTVIDAHARCGDFQGMHEWLNRMSNANEKPDLHVYNIILKSFASRGDVQAVANLLDQMRVSKVLPDIVSYTSVIKLLAQRKDSLGAEDMYRRAIAEGIIPDQMLITTVMDAHVEAGTWHGVIRAYDYLRSVPTRHLRLNIDVLNTLLKAYVFVGTPYRIVADIFYRLCRSGSQPTEHTYALVIQSACDSGDMVAASDLYLRMQELASEKHSSVRMSVEVMTIIMTGYLRQGDKASAKAVYDDMRVLGIQPSAVTFKAILNAYSNEGTEDSLRLAEEFMKSLTTSEENVKVLTKTSGERSTALEELYTPLIQAHNRSQQHDEAQRLYSELMEQGGRPSVSSLTLLLDSYRRAGNISGVKKTWPHLLELCLRLSKADALYTDVDKEALAYDSHRQATILCIPLSIYIDALSYAGLHLEVAGVWNELRKKGFKFDSHNWNHLVVALIRAGQPERAFEVVEKVILPYQEQVSKVRFEREEVPSSPLWSERSPTHDDLTDIMPDSPLHKGARRSQAMRMMESSINTTPDLQSSVADDYGHSLHVLHQIAPSWSAWKVHWVVLGLLARVLHNLESGLEIRPVKSTDEQMAECDDPLARAEQNDTYEKRIGKQQKSAQILRRLYEKYPKALRAVEFWERNKDDDNPYHNIDLSKTASNIQ